MRFTLFRKIFGMTAVSLLVAGLCTGVGIGKDATTVEEIVKDVAASKMPGILNSGSRSENNGYVGMERAIKVAFGHAKVSETDVLSFEADLERDDGRVIYELEFNTARAEYEYEIDAISGTVIFSKREREREDSRRSRDSSKFIGFVKAQNAALRHAGLSVSQVTFTELDLDTRRNQGVYEMKFTTGRSRYDYEVDAVSGKILYDRSRNDNKRRDDNRNR